MPPKMDLSVVAAYGDDIWNSKADSDVDESGDNATEPSAAKQKMKKKRSVQDSVVSAQIYLAVAAVVIFFVVKFAFPDLFQTLYSQYIDFISEVPVWDLDGIVDAFSPDKDAATIIDFL